MDTEYHGPTTLTVQTAYRTPDGGVTARLYRDPSVPDLPAGLDLATAVAPEGDPVGALCGGLTVPPIGPVTRTLSPAVLVRDALGLPTAEPLSRGAFARAVADRTKTDPPPFANARWAPGKQQWVVPAVDVTFVSHFLRADLTRMFGAGFFDELFRVDGPVRPVGLRGRGLLRFDDPVLQYLAAGGNAYALRVAFRDTNLLFGPNSLDALARAFLGAGKDEALTGADKADMARAFRDHTAAAYTYAARDAVQTLLLFERMARVDGALPGLLGHRADGPRAVRPTLGGRVSDLVVRDALHRSAPARTDAALSRRELEDLAQQGGRELSQPPHGSKFGPQVLGVHGGLLYTRSPATLWHEAPGMLRDVDLAGFYGGILSGISVYLGRPVVLEPGANGMTLKAAVALARRHAEPDGWLIRASGPIEGFTNVLVPSTEDALTTAGYRESLRRGTRAGAARRAAHLERLADPGAWEAGGARLYASVVESGVVTDATWRVIRLLPPAVRKQYEELTVDTVLLYPRALAADDADQFRALRDERRGDGTPWRQRLDLGGMRVVEERVLDHEFVALRYPAGLPHYEPMTA